MNLENNILQIPLEDIIPNRFQPRLNFEDQGLEELANSIRQHGVIQPLVVRRIGDKYEIIAGERRYKASSMAGLKTVPAVVAQIDDNKSAEVAIVENVQRRDLTPIEEARSYKNLLDKGYLTQTELAKKMGISQSAIANKLRLLNLDTRVQEALMNNEISERHARSLLTLDSNEEQCRWLDRIIKERMTVKDLDDALKNAQNTPDSNEKNNINNNVQLTNNDEDEGIPTIKPLDLETMQHEATELPDVNDPNLLQKISEIEKEKKYNPDVIPVDQAKNDAKNNFFNFLENEKVNMNMEENNIEAPVSFDATPIETETPNTETHNNDLDEPIINLNIPPEEPANVEPLNEEPVDIQKEEVINLQPQETTDNLTTDDDFDPVNLIDTLSPTYQDEIETKLGIDLKNAINEIRNTKDILTNRGFNISLEEVDLDNEYEFIIKVKKD